MKDKFYIKKLAIQPSGFLETKRQSTDSTEQ